MDNFLLSTFFAIFAAVWESVYIMGFFERLLDTMRRNPLTTVLLIMLIVAAPGVLGVFAIVLFIPLIVAIIGVVILLFRVRKIQKQMSGNGGGNTHNSQDGGRGKSSKSGKVTLHIPPQEQRVNDDVGEYVPFKEVKEQSDKE